MGTAGGVVAGAEGMGAGAVGLEVGAGIVGTGEGGGGGGTVTATGGGGVVEVAGVAGAAEGSFPESYTMSGSLSGTRTNLKTP